MTVDVLTDYGTTEEQYTRKQIAINEKDAMLELEAKTGHRETPIVEGEIEQAQMKRLAAGREVLAQQSTGGTNATNGQHVLCRFLDATTSDCRPRRSLSFSRRSRWLSASIDGPT